MMKHKTWLNVALLAFLAASPVSGQSGSAKEALPGGYRFGLSVDGVHLAATVVTEKGRLVTDLEKEDFVIYEDDVPQEIQYFSRGADAPVDVILLVDASGSMGMASKVTNARTTAIQLIHSLGPEDRVAVFSFDRDIVQLCSFTENKETAIRALDQLEPFGSTAIHDAVAKVPTIIQGQGFGRRAIVLISDGVDTSSELSVEEAVEIAKGVDLPVYAIRVLSPLDDPSSDKFLGVHGPEAKDGRPLDRFAEETGGKLYEGSQLGLLRLISVRIREELKTQYRLGYVSRNPRQDGRFRRIELFVRKEGVAVRTRKGYYAKGREAALKYWEHLH